MNLLDSAKIFFERINSMDNCKTTLTELNQVFQFSMKDEEPFYVEVSSGKITVRSGEYKGKPEEMCTFRTNKETVKMILTGTLRYSDALTPIGPHIIVLEDNFLIKIQTVSLLGQLVRKRQESLGKGTEAPTYFT